MKASCIMARLEEMRRSQFFHNLRHFSNQEKLRSTTRAFRSNNKAVQVTSFGDFYFCVNKGFNRGSKGFTRIVPID